MLAVQLQTAGSRFESIQREHMRSVRLDGGQLCELDTLELLSFQQLPSLGHLLDALLASSAPPLERWCSRMACWI